MRFALTVLSLLAVSVSAKALEPCITLPDAQQPRLIVLCDIIRNTVDPYPATWDLDDCMTKFVHRNIKQWNRKISQNIRRQEADAAVETDTSAFDQSMPE